MLGLKIAKQLFTRAHYEAHLPAHGEPLGGVQGRLQGIATPLRRAGARPNTLRLGL